MLPPDTLVHQRYRIRRQIGRGGMGTVYEALDEHLDSPVALKQRVVRAAEFDIAFKREAQLLAALRHPALPLVTDFFNADDHQFLVMQFIPGDDLATVLKERSGPLPPWHVFRLAEQLFAVLVYLHTQQPPIIHRDIKPQNLKETPSGDLVLLDFGLAKLLPVKQGLLMPDELPPTDPSLNAFTPQYAALEQIEGVDSDPRSDVYAASATLYHLFTGVAPAPALARVHAVIARKPDPLRPAHIVYPDVPTAISDVLQRGLALHTDDRPAGAAEMLRLLRAAGQQSWVEPTKAVTRSEAMVRLSKEESFPSTRTPSFRSRSKLMLLTAVVTLAAVIVAIAFLARQAAPVNNGEVAPLVGQGRAAEGSVAQEPQASDEEQRGAQNTPEASAGAQPDSSFYQVPLREQANATLDFTLPPSGDVTLGGIPFNLSDHAFKSQSSFPPGDSAPTDLVVPLQVPQAYRLHLLLNTGNGFTLYKAKIIGEVTVVCGDTRVVVASLQLGREVREWHAEGRVVDTASRSRQVWQGARTDAPHLEGYIDLLSLDLPPVCRAESLSAIEIRDQSVTTVNSLDPALNLVGLTVEHYP